MSYVLDALSKSAQEGQAASARAAGMLDSVRGERGRGANLSSPLLAGAALAVVVAGAFGWMWSHHVATGVAGQPVVAGSSALATAQVEDAAALRLSLAIANTALPAAPLAKPSSASAAKKSGASSAPVGARPAPSMAPADKAVSGAQAPPTAGAELPAALRQQLPKLAISGYILDKQAGSLAIIDDKVRRVGEEAAPGLRIEKIDADGVAFSYRGYRFRR